MDVTHKARGVLASAREAAGRVLPGRAAEKNPLDPSRPGPHGVSQTLTISRPPQEVIAACRDPRVLSRLLGDLGRVETGEGDRVTFVLTSEGEEMSVDTRAVAVEDGVEFRRLADPGTAPGGGDDEAVARPEDDTEGGLTGAPPPQGQAAPEGSALLTVLALPAPRDLGAEVRFVLDLPAGAVAFTLLYRLRALLQTGEIPTLRPQPAAREEDR
ncbi:hypothetical protein GTQ99_18670 [Kineococcus sp. T13]|uniref:hypothetical protein n=1 Tax=Kineococcus vitellinus TaxID=2696565 RepID=UPI0014133455|nr:hypothetical protein [Kineococcus vitellinus]NAZ77430.1 hypothetical protein [Kineococcus vitellinus]